jgi:hypothetical protein
MSMGVLTGSGDGLEDPNYRRTRANMNHKSGKENAPERGFCMIAESSSTKW